MRRFDERTLRTLFRDYSFDLATIDYLGGRIVRYDQEFRERVRQAFSPSSRRTPPSYAICPSCGFHDKSRLAEDLASIPSSWLIDLRRRILTAQSGRAQAGPAYGGPAYGGPAYGGPAYGGPAYGSAVHGSPIAEA